MAEKLHFIKRDSEKGKIEREKKKINNKGIFCNTHHTYIKSYKIVHNIVKTD